MIEITEDINAICADFLERYKKAIQDEGHTASAQLEKTATYKIKWDGRYFELSFNLESYWKYLESGTKPHFPPVDKIEEWIRVKRIVPVGINSRVPSTRQLAYLISREISINGTKPTKLLQKTIDSSDDLINAIADRLLDLMNEEINKEIEQTMQ